MNLHQSQHIRKNTQLYDILGRAYIVHNYFLQYLDNEIVDVYLDLKNEFGDSYGNINYRYVYFSTEEFTDTEVAFHNWCSQHYFDKSLNTYHMTHKELHDMLSYFTEGYNSCYENFRNKKVG
jgi:hypothetical protein